MAGGFRSFRDLQRAGEPRGGNDNDDDDDDLDHRLYTGNGLNVDSNPTGARMGQETRDQLLQNLMREAANQGSRPDDNNQSPNFGGQGQTLGGDGEESRTIYGVVSRRMTIWRNGFSFDGDRFIARDESDPVQINILRRLQRGQAPVEWLDVQPGQEVRLELVDNSGVDYREAPGRVSAFSGAGNSFGASAAASESSSAATTASVVPANIGSTSAAQKPVVNRDLPIIKIRFTLPSSTQTIEFNGTHTMADLYSYVASVESASFELVTATGALLVNGPTQLQEFPPLKRGGVVRFKTIK